MKIVIGLLLAASWIPSLTHAENLTSSAEFLCATKNAHLCFETGECFDALPADLGMPEFVVIDTKKKSISTTKVSGLNRSSAASMFERNDGVVAMQGMDSGRAFSFMIHEETGLLTASIAADGYSVAAFGACTAH
ncbi:MAG: hypothetical protein ACI87W_001118 [Halieaceae bacterium]|jgi:hypothetical protein